MRAFFLIAAIMAAGVFADSTFQIQSGEQFEAPAYDEYSFTFVSNVATIKECFEIQSNDTILSRVVPTFNLVDANLDYSNVNIDDTTTASRSANQNNIQQAKAGCGVDTRISGTSTDADNSNGFVPVYADRVWAVARNGNTYCLNYFNTKLANAAKATTVVPLSHLPDFTSAAWTTNLRPPAADLDDDEVNSNQHFRFLVTRRLWACKYNSNYASWRLNRRTGNDAFDESVTQGNSTLTNINKYDTGIHPSNITSTDANGGVNVKIAYRQDEWKIYKNSWASDVYTEILSTNAGVEPLNNDNPLHVSGEDQYESPGTYGAPAFSEGHGRRKFEQPFARNCIQLSKWRCIPGGGPHITETADDNDDWSGSVPAVPARTAERSATGNKLLVAAGARNCWHISGDNETLPVYQDETYRWEWNSDSELGSNAVSANEITEQMACASSTALLARSALNASFSPSHLWNNNIGLATEVIGADGQGGLLNTFLNNLPSVVKYDGRTLTKSTDIDTQFAVKKNADYPVIVQNAEVSRNSRGFGRNSNTFIYIDTDPTGLTTTATTYDIDPDYDTRQSWSSLSVRPYDHVFSGNQYFIQVESPRKFRYSKQCTDVASSIGAYQFSCSTSYEDKIESTSFNTGHNNNPTSQINFFPASDVLEVDADGAFVSHDDFNYNVLSDPVSIGKLMNRYEDYYNSPNQKTAVGLDVLNDYSAKTQFDKDRADVTSSNGVNYGDALFTFALLFFFSILIGAGLIASSCFGAFAPKAPTAAAKA